jgi:competence protein ComEC
VRFERGALQRARAAASARRERAAARLAEAGAGLAGALALGARGGLAPGDEETLRAAGLAHLLAVSGLNLVMVAALAFGGVRRILLRAAPTALGDPRRKALAGAWLAALAYAAMTGWEVSVRRAFAFLSVACLALVLRRPVAAAQVVAAAGLAVLAAEPGALFEPGAQLSFAAAAALLLARASDATPERVGERGVARLRSLAGAGLRTSATALAATVPLAALHFGRVAPAALVANLGAVPFTELLLLPASLVAALAALAAPDAPALAAAPAAVVRLGGALLTAFARAAIQGPGAELNAAPAPLAVAAAAVCGAAGLVARTTYVRLLWLAAVHSALFALPPPRLLPGPPRVVALDVGQGDAIVVQGLRGTLLVDGGTALPGGGDLGRSVVVPALAALGIRRLDVVAASHADLDHRGGLMSVLEAVPTARLWLPAGGAAEPGFAALLATARRRGVAVEERGAGDPPVAFGDLWVETPWPPRSDTARALRDNDRSLVLRVRAEGEQTRVLLTGDVEAAAEGALLADPSSLEAEVLKLAHHGSRTSSGRAFLERVGAQVAIASAPCLGRFAMPHTEVRRRAAAAGASLWWTGRDGAVVVSLTRLLVARGLAPAQRPRERWRCQGDAAR